MRRSIHRRSEILAATAVLVLAATAPAAAAEREPGWSDVAEFSLVVTSGNSETETLGFKNTLTRNWEDAVFVLKAGGIRSESTTVVAAVGTPSDFSLIEETNRTAESYYLNGRYSKDISPRFYWYTGAGWDRNRFAGIENRYVIEGGVGNIWINEDDLKFNTSYGLTYTDQEDVVIDPTVDDSFIGARFAWDYLNKLGKNATYTNTLVVDGNAEETSDFRADMINSIAVSMSEKMALKVSLQWLYDNEPASATYALEQPRGTSTGETGIRKLDDLDSIFTMSLVVNF